MRMSFDRHKNCIGCGQCFYCGCCICNKKVKVQLKYEENTTFGWVEEYGLTVSGKDKEDVLEKVKKAVKHLEKVKR